MERTGPGVQVNTFLLTDIEGSTSLWENEPEATSKAVSRHDQIIGDTVDRNGGFLVKSKGEGDATFCVFESPQNALIAAVAIQSSFANEKWTTSRPIRVRIAIHEGPAEARDGDFFGPTIIRCARIRSIAHGGQILLSGAAQSNCRSTIKMRDHGPHRLKDLLSPERIFEALWTDQPFPALRSLNSLDHNLPVQLTSFIGRDKESAQIVECINEHRLVTIIGVGGTGKTRLALHVAAEIVSHGESCVRFISFSDLKPGSSVTPAIVRTALSGEAQNSSNISEAAAQFGDQVTTLIFDNCEHVVDSAADAANVLLANCPNVRIVATSREPLGVSGERAVPLEPLPMPPKDEIHPVRLRGYDSISLLLDRVRLRQPNFVLDAASAQPASTLVRALDGIPLAIEQVAARVGSLGLDEIVKRLEHRLDLLKSSDRFAAPRQRTVRATIEWSHDLLTASEKEAFAALGCFQGVFLIEDANFIVGRDAMDDVESLTNKSMLAHVSLSSHEVGYRMFESVREFARERSPNESPSAYEKHLQWALVTAIRLDEQMDDARAPDAFHSLDRCYSDLIAALSHALEVKEARSLELAFSMRKFWLMRGPLSDGADLLDQAISASNDTESALYVDAQNSLGAINMTLGNKKEALSRLEQAADGFLSLHMPTKAAASYANMGILHAMEGEFALAEPLFASSLRAYEAGGDKTGAAKVSLNFGRMLADAGHCERAMPYLLAALHHVDGRDIVREAIARLDICSLLPIEDVMARLTHLRRSFEILAMAPERSGLCIGLLQLARQSVRAGRIGAAITAYSAALECQKEDLAACSIATQSIMERLVESLQSASCPEEWHDGVEAGRKMDLMERIRFAQAQIVFIADSGQ